MKRNPFRRKSGSISVRRPLKRYKVSTILAGCVVISLGLAAAGGFFYFSMHPQEREFNATLHGRWDDEETVLRSIGRNVVNGMLRQGQAEIRILNGEGEQPLLAFHIAKSGNWEKRKPMEQKAICLYIESLVPQAKSLVGNYIPQGMENPRYEEIVANVRDNLCASCWGVTEGDGRYLLVGTKAWNSLPDPVGVDTWLDLKRRVAAQ